MRLVMFQRFSPLKLLSVVDTRFASIIVMLKRFKLIKQGLQTMVISDEWNSYREDDMGKANFVKEKLVMGKFLYLRMCNLLWSPTNENLKSFRTFTTLAYLRDGSTKYFDFVFIGIRVTRLRYALVVAKHGSVNTNYAQGGVGVGT
ncbi:hypothetical protein V6N12_002990 [Hibiscus sabdariffa]|uniref:ISXO2-like transposase domain-containing protein n=1 Tax=Hibiscus sabdariffa TaxID=183260 RepID=A0ABR2EAK5_9ROSI